ncbi:hypothetical protein HID58_054653 [Brassica napus]|uniref:non-specific serine/threonine protein kinase n=1 Tax=Brassica napus TaxID=3708 RepID=A0ABQ8AI46_BRANA|nr:hypothetical protein HID58_054653 [Brassica napus]
MYVSPRTRSEFKTRGRIIGSSRSISEAEVSQTTFGGGFKLRVMTKKGTQIIPRCSNRQKALTLLPLRGQLLSEDRKKHTVAQGSLRQLVNQKVNHKRKNPSPAEVRLPEEVHDEEPVDVRNEEPEDVHDEDPDAWRYVQDPEDELEKEDEENDYEEVEEANYVALKIQKSAQQLVQAALHEIELLQAAADGDPANTKCVVRLIDDFKHAGPNGQHLCMVLEFLSDSLLRLIRYNRYKAMELIKVREICKCVLTGLDYLHRELGMIHTDLKPENILLRTTIDTAKDPIRSGLTPLLEKPEGNQNGAATTMNLIEKKLKRRARRAVAKNIGKEGFDNAKLWTLGMVVGLITKFAEEIQTKQCRAPEVILQSGYSFSADMWSFASRQLFAPKDGNGYGEDEDHLALMMELLGKMPRKIATGGARSEDYFDRHGDLKRIRRLNIGRLNFLEAEAREFADFFCPMLAFAPERRPAAQQCLQHPWLNLETQNNGDHIEAQMRNLHIKG